MLYIFDCCSAGSVAMNDGPETIAAVGWERMASKLLGFSFAQALIDTLKDLHGQPETIAGIYSRLFRNAHQNQVGACPTHVPKNGAPSITIAKHSRTRVMTRKQTGHLPSMSEHRVLLSVHIRDVVGEPDFDQWSKWLTKNLPVGVLCWCDDRVGNPTFNFIAHVNSNNVLPQLESNIQSSLPFRPIPPSGSENQPFSHSQRKSLG